MEKPIDFGIPTVAEAMANLARNMESLFKIKPQRKPTDYFFLSEYKKLYLSWWDRFVLWREQGVWF